ncbi:transcriptional regulator, LacI family [Faunimonas pinastri]|uniref:Transcriptional regulator, LacI family n=1 Tax=Faunimonas pinastri TaxID=1855383 RepID=A0A1H9EJ54_9HYPH|nr:LacI family DNA-binding transcriptional regulator [Faunimonas pinastri]SEQ25786.1 transcriptional regulator, LacI family [Faunimonas pinastri]
MNDRKSRITIYDVARETGLAPSTVSNALAGKGHVSEKSRLLVQEAATRLGYRALPLARALRLQRSFTIGVLIADIANPAFPDFVRGVEDVVVREKCTLLLCNTDGQEASQIEQMDALGDRGVDGIVLISQHTRSPEIRQRLQAGPPFVLVQRRSAGFEDDYVGSDNAGAIEAAVRHLAGLGHSRIAFVRGPVESSTALERLDAFRQAVVGFGLDPDPQLIYPGDYSMASGYQAAMLLLNSRHPPTAIIASDDMNALGIMEAAHRLRAPIPQRLSVIGFDDITLASFGRIDLTTIHLPKRDMGRAAAELLVRRIAGDRHEPARLIMFPTQLVIRGSTGPAPAWQEALARGREAENGVEASVSASAASAGGLSPRG